MRVLAAMVVMLTLGAALLLPGTAAKAEQAPARDGHTRLADPAQERRAERLFEQLRCVVCQNNSIADSPADMAADMRAVVRRQVAEGASNEAVRQFMVDRYGRYVLMRPPVEPATWALWLTPAVVLLVGAGSLVVIIRRRGAPVGGAEDRPLDSAERQSLDQLLASDGRDA